MDRPSQSKKPRHEIDAVRQELVQFELRALSLVLEHWASPSIVRERGKKGQWENKLPAFRGALIAGMDTGRRQVGGPHELIAADYAAVYPMIQWIKNNRASQDTDATVDWLRKVDIPVEIPLAPGRSFKMVRPTPVPEAKIRDLVQAVVQDTPQDVALEVVGWRLRVSASKVRAAARAKRKKQLRFRATAAHENLVSVFFDLASIQAPQQQFPRIQAEILNSLFLSRFRKMALCYLVQKAHALPARTYVGTYDRDAVRRLCRTNCSQLKTPAALPFRG